MSCRRVSRELLELFRFGDELDSRSEPHLRHLQSCGACREEVGLDRALVIQLRRALEARVGDATPSARTWETVRSRALSADAPPPTLASVWRWMRLVPATAVMTMLILAVTVMPESQRPIAVQVQDWQGYELRPAAEPEWQMPWWLAARTGPPPAPRPRGPLAMPAAASDQAGSVRLGPFAESLQ